MSPPLAAPAGRRARNKEDKLRRIKQAARKLFIANGYDEASTRQIAAKAGVALGTLFLYAADKRDLLFLVVNDELDAVARQAAAAVHPDATLTDNLTAAFRPVYAFFGAEPRLSRLTLREMMFYESGPQAQRFIATRDTMRTICIDIIRLAQQRGEIGRQHAPERIGHVLFSIFKIEIRDWLMHRHGDVEDGLAELQRNVDIVRTGLVPREVPQ